MMHPLMSSETVTALRPQKKNEREKKKLSEINKENKEQVMDRKKSL